MEREVGPFSPDLLLRFRLLDLMIALIIAETAVSLPPQFAQNQRAARRYQRPPRAESGRALSQLRIARASGVAEDSPLAFGDRKLHGFGLRIEQDQRPRPFIAPGAVFDQESDARFRDW